MAPRIRQIPPRVIRYSDDWTPAQIPTPEAPRLPPAQQGLGHPVLQFSTVSEEHQRLEEIQGFDFLDTCVFDQPLLTRWGVWPYFEQTLGPRWIAVLMPLAPTFDELTLEFQATLRVDRSQLEHRRAISFSLGRQVYEMSLADLAVHLGFFTEADARRPDFYELPRTICRGAERPRTVGIRVLETFWETIADAHYISGIPESLILDARHRLIHRIIANTICGRHFSQEKVQQTDLLCLWSILTSTPVNQACLFLDLATRTLTGQGARLATGPYVTRIAHSLRVFRRWPRKAFAKVYTAPTFYDHNRMIAASMCPADSSIEGFLPTPAPAERQPRPPGVHHQRPTARELTSRKRARQTDAGEGTSAAAAAETHTQEQPEEQPAAEVEAEFEADGSLSQRFDQLEARFTGLEGEFSELRAEVRDTLARMEQLFMAALDRQESSTGPSTSTPADIRGKAPAE